MLKLEVASGVTGSDWTKAEIDNAVTTYFTMLIWDLDGTPYVKADVKKVASRVLPARTVNSIENKWCNISVVLEEKGLPTVSGLPPRAHIQNQLRDSVDEWLATHPATARAVRR